jgi:hypothetical protein
MNGIKVIGNYMPSNHDASRIVDNSGLAPTVKENHGTVTATNYGLRIRKLTPKECWRLMGFDDEDFEKAEKVNSNTQLYKQARKLNRRQCIRKNIRKLIKYGGSNMNIEEAIKILTENDISDFYFDHSECCDFSDENNYRQAVETVINEYNDLKQIEEAHRIENGQLRSQINNKEKDFAMQLLYNNIIGKKDGKAGKWTWYANEEDCKRLVKELIKNGGTICIKN